MGSGDAVTLLPVDGSFDIFGNSLLAKRPEGMGDDEWLRLEKKSFKKRIRGAIRANRDHWVFMRQCVESSEIDKLEALVKALEREVRDAGKTDFWLDLFSFFFGTLFTSLIKLVGEKLVAKLAGYIFDNKLKYNVVSALQISTLQYLEAEQFSALKMEKIEGLLLEKAGPGILEKLFQANATTNFTQFVKAGKSELYRMASKVKKQKPSSQGGFIKEMRNLIHSEELFLSKSRDELTTYMEEILDHVDHWDIEHVDRKVNLLRMAMPVEMKSWEELEDQAFRKSVIGLFIGYGVALARHFVEKDVILTPLGESTGMPSHLLNLPFGARILLSGYSKGDADGFDLVNATHALELAKLIPVLEDVSVGRGRESGLSLFKLKKGTYLGDYFLLSEMDLVGMVLDVKTPFSKYLIETHYPGQAYILYEILQEKLARYQADQAAKALPYNNYPGDSELAEDVKNELEKIRKVFEHKYLPEVIDSLIRPVLLQYIKDFRKKRKVMRDIPEVARAFRSV